MINNGAKEQPRPNSDQLSPERIQTIQQYVKQAIHQSLDLKSFGKFQLDMHRGVYSFDEIANHKSLVALNVIEEYRYAVQFIDETFLMSDGTLSTDFDHEVSHFQEAVNQGREAYLCILVGSKNKKIENDQISWDRLIFKLVTILRLPKEEIGSENHQKIILAPDHPSPHDIKTFRKFHT